MKNLKSTLSGIVILLGVVIHAVNDPKVLQDPMTLSTIAAGVGMIFAADASAVKMKTDKEIAAEPK